MISDVRPQIEVGKACFSRVPSFYARTGTKDALFFVHCSGRRTSGDGPLKHKCMYLDIASYTSRLTAV